VEEGRNFGPLKAKPRNQRRQQKISGSAGDNHDVWVEVVEKRRDRLETRANRRVVELRVNRKISGKETRG